jgi:hypothetical protein
LKPLVPLVIPTETHVTTTLHDFPKGVLMLLTASWCAHCGATLREFHKVVGALRDHVVVATFEAHTGFLQRYHVRSVPAVVFFDAKRGHVVMTRREKTAEAIVSFAAPLLPSSPDADLPLYTEPSAEWWEGRQESDATSSDDAAKSAFDGAEVENVITTEEQLERAKRAVAEPTTAPNKKGVVALLIVVTTPACRGPACDEVGVLSRFIHGSFSKMNVLVATTNNSVIARRLGAVTVPAVALFCQGWSGIRSVGRLHQPGTQKYLRDLSPKQLVAHRLNDLIDGKCAAKPKNAFETKSDDELKLDLDSTTRKPDRTVTVDELWDAHRRDSSLVYLRPSDCGTLCTTFDDAWAVSRTLATDEERGAAATTNFFVLDPRLPENRPLRQPLFAKKMRVPMIAFVPGDTDDAKSIDEKAQKLVGILYPYKGVPTGAGIVDFLDKMYRGEPA